MCFLVNLLQIDYNDSKNSGARSFWRLFMRGKQRMNTRIYFLDVESAIDEAQIFRLGKSLSKYRQEKIKRMKFREDKLLSLGAGFLLDQGLKQWGLSEQTAAFTYGANGKPFLRDDPERYFNLSHSGSLVMAVFSDHEVGCDVEQIHSGKLRVAHRFFTEKEQGYLSDPALSEAERDALFTRLWTLKESVLKVTGEGMGMALNSFEFSLSDPVKVSLGEEYSFLEYGGEGYRAAVCVKGGQEVLSDVFFSFQKLQDVVR